MDQPPSEIPVEELRRLKRDCRKRMKRRLNLLAHADSASIARQEAELTRLFPTLDGYAESATVLLYVGSLAEEFSTTAMIQAAINSGRRVALPVVDSATPRLIPRLVKDLRRDLASGSTGLVEPTLLCPEVKVVEIDWVLVPGLAFDARCNRLGRGAGYYDRLLKELRLDAPRVALALEDQIILEVPVGRHDQPLDAVVTATRSFRRRSAG